MTRERLLRRPPHELARAIASRSIAALVALAASQTACPGSLDDPSLFAGDGGSGGSAPAPLAEAGVATVEASAPACPDVTTAIFAPSCGAAGCHGASTPASGLDLVSPGLAARVLGVRAQGGGALLVDPASPPASVLYTKLLAAPPFGSRMPLGGTPLDAASVACVLSWAQGLGAPGQSAGPDGGSAAEAGPAWLPTSSQATVLWLDASQGVTATGGAVTAWKDRSSSGNNAASSDASTAPSLDATAIHGLPALRFDETKGTFIAVPDAPSLQWGTGGYLVAMVGIDQKATAGLGHGHGVSTAFAKPQQQGAVEITIHFNYFTAETTDDDSFFNAEMGEGEPGLTSMTKGYNDGAPRLYVARVDTSSGKTAMHLRVNGVEVGASSGDALVDVTLAGSPIRIGSTYGQSVQGAIAEVVAMRGTIPDADVAKLESYLMTKYALAPEAGQ